MAAQMLQTVSFPRGDREFDVHSNSVDFMEVCSKVANLKSAEVTTDCSNFYCYKATYKGSEGFEPLKGGLAPESH